jgi:predicted small lipoprotein YifL
LKSAFVKYSLLISLFVFTVCGCGLKGNPSSFPVSPDQKPAVKNIAVDIESEAIIISWNFQDKRGLVNYIGVERSELGTAGNECKDCPRTFAGIGRVFVKETKSNNEGLKKFSYKDKSVRKSKTYTYRLMLCEDNGNCVEAATVEKIFDK